MSAAHRSSIHRNSATRSRRARGIPMPAPANSPATPDYAQQLHAAILATREVILTEQTTADANRSTALGGLDVSRRTFADARIGLTAANATLAVTAFLDRKLGDASLTSNNVVALAENSNTEAITAAAAAADAATSIKAAATALDEVIMDVNGVAGITKNNDKDEPVNAAAHAAVLAVAKVGQAVEELKWLALRANIQAARPSTAAPVLAGQGNQSSIGALLTTLDATLKTTTDALTAAQTARTADLTDLFTHSEAFTVASSDDGALKEALRVIDEIGNDSLTASVHNLDEGETPQKKAGLRASWDFSEAVAETTVSITCFAVPTAYAPSFDFAAASKNPNGVTVSFQKGGPKTSDVVKANQKYADLQVDSNGNPIAFGSSYSIFALRMPTPEHGPQTATHFSFPTPPIVSTVLLSQPAPLVLPLSGTAFIALFKDAAPVVSVESYRLFFSPTESLERSAADELQIADALNAASYTEIKRWSPKVRPLTRSTATLARSIWKELVGETKPGLAVPKEEAANGHAKIERWLKHHDKHLASVHIVLFSAYATSERADDGRGLIVGRFTDMYGDLFDLEHRTYQGFVLAVGASHDGVQQAANVLSGPSNVFPATTPDEPLPTDLPTPKTNQK